MNLLLYPFVKKILEKAINFYYDNNSDNKYISYDKIMTINDINEYSKEDIMLMKDALEFFFLEGKKIFSLDIEVMKFLDDTSILYNDFDKYYNMYKYDNLYTRILSIIYIEIYDMLSSKRV